MQEHLENPADAGVFSVGALNRAVATVLARTLAMVWVRGEVSNLTRAASGHWYFVLKDEQALVRAVMFRGRNQAVPFTLANGDRIEVRAQATLYEARGEFQLNVEQMRRAGTGDLYERFLRLKAQLESEGLFDPDRKRPLPSQPRCIGVVTSLQAAALRDVLATLSHRAPHIPVVLYPAAVQGAQAPTELRAALVKAGQRRDCDLLLLVRGGGSIEDLWAFNDESLARAIAASPIPVVSGVGHETDFTIADFAADLRAPTPTAAATLAVPSRSEQIAQLHQQAQRLQRGWERWLERSEQRFDLATQRLRPPSLQQARQRARLEQLAHRLAVTLPRQMARHASRVSVYAATLRPPEISGRAAQLDAAARALAGATRRRWEGVQARLELALTTLESVSPAAVMARGYALVQDEEGRLVRKATQLAAGAPIVVSLAEGQVRATVTESHRGPNPLSSGGFD